MVDRQNSRAMYFKSCDSCDSCDSCEVLFITLQEQGCGAEMHRDKMNGICNVVNHFSKYVPFDILL